MNKANAEIHIDTHVQVCVWKKIQFDFEAMCAVRATSFFPFLFHFFQLFWHSVWISYGLLFYSIKCLVCCLNLSIVKWRQDKKRQYTPDVCMIQPKYKVFQSIRIDQFHQMDREKERHQWRRWKEADRQAKRERRTSRTCAIALHTATQWTIIWSYREYRASNGQKRSRVDRLN